MSKGPGGKVYRTAAAEDDLESPPVARPARQSTSINSEHQGLCQQDDVVKYKDLLLSELTGRGGVANENEIRERLKWGEIFYWQVMAEVFDDGSKALPGDYFPSLKDAGKHMREVLRKMLLADDPISVETLAGELHASKKAVVAACARLIRWDLMTPLHGGGQVALARKVLDPKGSSDVKSLLHSAQSIAGDSEVVSLQALAEALGWTQFRTGQVVKECVKQGVLGRGKRDAGLVRVTSSGKQLLKDVAGDDGGANAFEATKELRDLHDEVRKNNVIAFVGAGISAGMGLPNWEELINELVHKEQLSPEVGEVNRLIDQKLFVDAMSALERLMGQHRFVETVQQALNVERRRLPVSAALVALAVLSEKLRSVVTTNLDTLIENAIDRGTVARVDGDSIQRNRGVLHLHGVLGSPETWALTRAQYNKKYHHGPYVDVFNGMFTGGSTLMFIGYGMSDYGLNLILDRFEGAYDPLQQPRHFFFMKSGEADEKPYFISRLERLGMRLIRLNDYDQLPGILVRLAQD